MRSSGNFRHRSVGLFVALILALVALGACGGGAKEGAESSAPAAAEPATAAAAGEVDACAIVTQEDATALFGQPASPQEGTPVLSGNLFGQCLWTWDTDTSNQLLQFSIWTAAAYGPPDDAVPIDLGEEGTVRTHPMAGVDVSWIQGGRMISLSYSTIGPDAPKAASRAEEVKALARKVAGRL